ncbi:exopolysaccharide Pel transporter PelG [Aureimonas ureilytica]|uniref:exopolysaccharide Pel transporter PelG n=1 Tax=Aureimonas ureilytica TaxID=401562 RepID=UPI0003700C5F|nr:exopolysaccharide Pel transporter PelG [Aureimonas ureilytica]
MAGIGFELRRLAREGGVIRPVASAGHGAVVAAGPWLLTVLALSIIQHRLPRSTQAAYDLQALVIYVFCLSLVVTAPLVAGALRLAADDLHLRKPDRIRATYLVSLAASIVATALVALFLFRFGFGWRGEPLLAASAASGATAAIWPATAFCAATHDFGSITRGFVLGLILAVGATLHGASAGLTPPIQALLFAAGLWFTAVWLTGRVLSTFPADVRNIGAALWRILETTRRHSAVVLGALVATLAIWVDSWILWFGPAGLAVASGLPTAPFYDSAMFVARLSMLPGLVLFLGSVDTGVFQAVRRFLGAVEGHASLSRIETLSVGMSREIDQLLVRMILVQATFSTVALALAPAFVEPAGLLYQQLGILRLGLLAALFHTIFFAATTLLLLLGQERRFLLAQLAFLASNAALTGATLAIGRDAYGFGYLAATALSALLAIWLLKRSQDAFVYLTFSAALEQSRNRPPLPLQAIPILLLSHLRRIALRATTRPSQSQETER